MVTEIRIYLEGGGNNNTSRRKLGAGFSAFLGELRERARESRLRWSIILCGPRGEAFASFRTALRAHPDAWNLLLVDSEAPVNKPAWAHLSKIDGWKTPEGARESQCHLMVQAVEAWLVADPDALAAGEAAGRQPAGLSRLTSAPDRFTAGLSRFTGGPDRFTGVLSRFTGG